jgi:endoglucanase Acf2
VLPDSEVASLLDGVQAAKRPAPSLARLADGLVAPTNRWYSGLVFGDTPEPVFPLPLSFELTGTGFAFGVPTVTTAPAIISAPAVAQVTLNLGADEAVVSRYDDVSVTVSLRRSGKSIGRVTIARGSPVVSFVADDAVDIRSSVALEKADGFYLAAAGEQSFGLVAPKATVEGDVVSLAAGESANWFAVPPDGSASKLAHFATAPLTGVTTNWHETTTQLTYATEGSAKTLIGVLPHQAESLASPTQCDLGSFATIYGALKLCAGSVLEWSAKALEPSAQLDVQSLSDADTAELRTQLGKDLASTGEFAADTYFGGKALARLANLLQLARALGDKAAASTARDRLATELERWGTGADCVERCFVYDKAVGGIVGEPASFGSDEFNDHHYHYGYFLYAAAVAVDDSPELADTLAPVMTLLAADLASGQSSDHFPARRAFDPYSAHSWASGYAPFADGNNQESSSEAVAAWNGLALWAAAVGDDALEGEARWMLANEAATAMRYWVDFDPSQAPYRGFDHSVVGIVWDGKTEYNTWFSSDAGAMLGIQLLPMQPVADYLSGDKDRILARVAEARTGTLFPDYVLMYEALAGDDVLQSARELPEASIDDGNSRSYLLAWIMNHR